MSDVFYAKVLHSVAMALRHKRFLAILPGLVLTIACSTTQYSESTSFSDELPVLMQAPFEYELVAQTITGREVVEKTRDYLLEHITIKSSIRRGVQKEPLDEVIVIERFQNADPDTPGIVVLPIFGGGYKVARYFAKYFANHGYSTYVVHREDKYKEDVCSNADASAVNMVLRQKQSIDWIISRDVPLGVFGVSAGGMKATMLAALDKRIKAVVIALAGADIALICAESEEGRIVDEREVLMAERDLSLDEFRDYVAQNTEMKLADYAAYIAPGKVLQFIAARDQTVPTEAQWKLHAALGKPRMHKIQAGHRTSLLYLPYIRSKSLKFFDEQLK
jgi:dienelactone hydrolase